MSYYKPITMAPTQSVFATRPGQHQFQGFVQLTPLTGLNALAPLDQIFINRDLVERERNNYAIEDVFGKRIYFVTEESDRICCLKTRPFKINVFDSGGDQVMKLVRPDACGLCCCGDSCGNTVEVSSGTTGELWGSTKATYSYNTPRYSVLDAQKQIVFTIVGPKCEKRGCTGPLVFYIFLPDETTIIGEIRKFINAQDYLGGARGHNKYGANNFASAQNDYLKGTSEKEKLGAQFPMDLDPRLKAVLIGAIFSIDFLYFPDAKAQLELDERYVEDAI